MQKSSNITTTGTSDPLTFSVNSIMGFGTTGTADDYVASVEVQLVNNGNWYTIQDAIEDGVAYSSNAGCVATRLNVSSMGTATSIDFEVNGTQE